MLSHWSLVRIQLGHPYFLNMTKTFKYDSDNNILQKCQRTVTSYQTTHLKHELAERLSVLAYLLHYFDNSLQGGENYEIQSENRRRQPRNKLYGN